MNQALVSVILPSLNVVQYIDNTIKSVREQSLREIEILCIDAGSTDGTLDIIRKHQALDPRVRLILSEKKSYGHQVNLGLKQAIGKYICIVETDDYILPGMLSTQFHIAESQDLEVLKADFYRFKEEEGREVRYLNRLTKANYLYNRVINSRQHPEVFAAVMNTWTGLYKKAFLDRWEIKHNETPGASFQDTGFWFLTMAYAQKLYFSSIPFYMNRRDNPNSSVYNKNKLYAFCDEYDYIYEQLNKHPEIKNRCMPEFQFYRVRSYNSSINRSGPDDLHDFVRRFKHDLDISKEKCELNLSLFSDFGKKQIDLLLNDPDKYAVERLKQPKPKYNLNANSNVVINCKPNRSAPKFSVIIPVYNAETYLKECLNSVLSQDLKDIEIICVDDGSTDSSLSILNEYALKDSRILILTQPNSGSGVARNLAISVAKGDFIAFMDADDYYPTKDILSTFYITATTQRSFIVGGSFSAIKDGKLTTKFVGEYSKYTFDEQKLVKFSDYQFDYGYHRFCYSREFIIEHNLLFPGYLRYQDPVFLSRVLVTAGKFVSIPKVTYCYRRNNAKVKWTKEKVLDLIDAINDELILSQENNYPELHALNVNRINKDFYKNILPFVVSKDLSVLEKLFKLNGNIDIQLLRNSGFKISNNYYYIRLLRALHTEASIYPESIIVKLKNGSSFSVGFDSQSEQKRIEILEKELKEQKARNTFLKNTISFRLGMLITAVPRKLIKLLKKKS